MHEPIRRGRHHLAGGALVALTLLPFLLGGCGGGDDDPPELPTDAGELRCVSPQGGGADLSLFQWAGELPEGGYFQVAVYDYNSGGVPLGPLIRSPELQELGPARELRGGLPRRDLLEGLRGERGAEDGCSQQRGRLALIYSW